MLPILPICVMVWSGLCVTAPYDRVVEMNGQLQRADAQGHPIHPSPADLARVGVALTIDNTDNAVAHRPDGLPYACEGGLCVRYRKHCTPDGLQCDYAWGLSAAPMDVDGARSGFYVQTFSLKARTAAARRKAERALFLSAPSEPDRSDWFLPISDLTETSATTTIPQCTRGEPNCPEG